MCACCLLLQVGPIYEDDLYEALVTPLVKGSRLHCFLDTCRGIFALGLPSCVYTRADGWSNWEVGAVSSEFFSVHILHCFLPLCLPSPSSMS